MPEPRQYLVVGPSWVGDMVMAQALYISLRQQYPDCSIDVIAPAWSLPILARMPEVRQGIELPIPHGELAFGTRRSAGRALRGRYSHAIVLPRSWKSALVPFFARVPVRTGYRGEMRYGVLNDLRTLDKTVLTRTVQRYVALGREDSSVAPPVPHPRLSIDADNQRRLAADLRLDLSRPAVAMMPGAEYGPAKQWPVAYYAQLAARLSAESWQVWVLGSGKEHAAGEEITRSLQHGTNLCGRTRLEDVVDLLALCGAAVTNDSGLMHVAAATATRVIAIYGSSTPAYTPPLTDEEHKTVFYLGLECSPCFERNCPLGHTNCLYGIQVDDVYAAVTETA